MGFFSRPDGSWLVKRFGPRIQIELADDEIVFRSGTRAISLTPHIYLQGERIVGFGTRPDQNAEEVNVFSGEAAGASREQLLSRLFAQTIVQVLQRSFTIRPDVRVLMRGANVSHEEVRDALKLAGARNIEVA